MVSTDEFVGKSALVIGGTTGIGAATVQALAARGCQVTFAGVERDVGAALQDSINSATALSAHAGRAHAGRTQFVAIDVRDEAQVADLTRRSIDRFGRVHFAVNNAGVEGPFGPIQDATEADFDRIIGVNLKGMWLGMKYQIRHMLEVGGGVIVNTSSSAGTMAIPQVGIYSASKHAIIGLSKAAALEQARAGIRINVVAPGPVRTGLLSRMVGGHISLDDIAERVPVGRISEPAEIAAAILWLCSDAASFVTGHTLAVDGGVTIV